MWSRMTAWAISSSFLMLLTACCSAFENQVYEDLRRTGQGQTPENWCTLPEERKLEIYQGCTIRDAVDREQATRAAIRGAPIPDFVPADCARYVCWSPTPPPPPTQTPAPTADAVIPAPPELPVRLVITPTVTLTRAPTALPPSPAIACLIPPILFDPPDGRSYPAKSAIFRWRSDHDLRPDEEYEVLVWAEGSSNPISLGTTRDKLLPVDFREWKLGTVGTFLWTVRIRRTDGKLLSCEEKPFKFTLAEGGGEAPPSPGGEPPAPSCDPHWQKCS